VLWLFQDVAFIFVAVAVAVAVAVVAVTAVVLIMAIVAAAMTIAFSEAVVVVVVVAAETFVRSNKKACHVYFHNIMNKCSFLGGEIILIFCKNLSVQKQTLAI
jgi:hypothetical protein